MGQHYKVVLIH